MHWVNALYRRAGALVRRWPWLPAVAVAAEFAQHAAEIHVGMYAHMMDAHGARIRLAFGLVKILVLFLTAIAAWRLWRFEGEVARALRPTLRLCGGIGLFLLVQLAGDGVALGVGRGLAWLAGDAGAGVRIAPAAAPLLVWLLASAALYPWYVALGVEDRSLSLRGSIAASLGRLPGTWGLVLAGVLPLMTVHYGLGYAALGGLPAWPLMIVDAGVVGLLTAAFAATYYTLYLRALPFGGEPLPARQDHAPGALSGNRQMSTHSAPTKVASRSGETSTELLSDPAAG